MQIVKIRLNYIVCVKIQRSDNGMLDHRVLLTPPPKSHKTQTPLPTPDPQLHTDLCDCPRGPELIICSMCTRMIDGRGGLCLC